MDYAVVHSGRRTIAIQIQRDGRVVIRAPYAATAEDIRRVVDSHRDWVEKTVRRQQEQLAASPPEPTAREMEELAVRVGNICPAGWPIGPPDGRDAHRPADHRRPDPLGQLLRKKQPLLFPVSHALSPGGHRRRGGP